MMKTLCSFLLTSLLFVGAAARGQVPVQTPPPGLDQAARTAQRRLEQSIAELAELRERAAEETISLTRRLNELESELSEVRREYQRTTGLLDTRALDLNNLRDEIKARRDEADFLSKWLGDYVLQFETRLHIAEIQRYSESLEAARLAPENKSLSEKEIYEAQAGLLAESLERLHETLGGTRFEGQAVEPGGLIKQGTFVMIGPAALFLSEDGQVVGTVEQRLGSHEPTVIAFENPADAEAARRVVSEAAGLFPLDPTLGNAHKIEATHETFLEHVKKGGVVMYPIFALAGAALLVALFKWLSMVFIRTPSQRKVRSLLDDVARHDEKATLHKARKIGGPVGAMLAAGVEHIREPRDLIEEVMFEKVLATRLRLEKFLPFIAISAAASPLLGLLGTVTGIINTFKLITVFGSGDVKTLSGGISEALITTEFGLIVAIPSLLIHALLSRKARGVINQMEKAAVALVNQIGKTPFPKDGDKVRAARPTVEPDPEPSRPAVPPNPPKAPGPDERDSDESAGGLMDRELVRVGKSDTVADAIGKTRSAGIGEDADSIFVVDEGGKYVGRVRFDHLIHQPEQVRVESLADAQPLFVRVDARPNEIQNLFTEHDLVSLPVLDHNDQLVGRIKRNGNGKSDGK
jgi:biopolymer transport protein ExbB